MEIYSIKVSLNKCSINSSSGYTNIFGRETLPKSIVFPKVRVKYRNSGESEHNGITKSYDLKEAYLTEKNWAGASCGSAYFIICNTSYYSLYNKEGIYINRLNVKKVGELVSVMGDTFVTRTADGTERVWNADGSLREEHTLLDSQLPETKKNKILRKGEYIYGLKF